MKTQNFVEKINTIKILKNLKKLFKKVWKMCWQNTTECVKIKLVHRSEQVNKKVHWKVNNKQYPLRNNQAVELKEI